MKLRYTLLCSLLIFTLISCGDDDDDDGPDTIDYELSVSANPTSVNEDGGEINLIVSLDKVNQGDAIPFEVSVSGTATLDEDYEITGTQAIANGAQSTTLTITTIDEDDVEENETIIITLQENQESVTIENGTTSLTIMDDDTTGSAGGAGSGGDGNGGTGGDGNGGDGGGSDTPVVVCDEADTYGIDLDPDNCTVDIETVLGIDSEYNEQVSNGNRVITTNSIPNHNVGQFPNMGNPHSIAEQDNTYSIPVTPTDNSEITLLTGTNGQPLYRFGVLYNGILLAPIAAEFFTNTQTGDDNTDWNENALSSEITLGTDCNNSHVFPSGEYHHHATPSAFIESLNIDGSSPVQVGWAADGYPVYYKYGNKNGSVVALTSGYQLKTTERGGDGVSAPSGCPDGTYTQDYEWVANVGDLDECNGYDDPALGYIYVITDTYPSIPRCFIATPSTDFTNN